MFERIQEPLTVDEGGGKKLSKRDENIKEWVGKPYEGIRLN